MTTFVLFAKIRYYDFDYYRGGDYNTVLLGLYNTVLLTAITPLTFLKKIADLTAITPLTS